jgi:hypothetical protein
LAGGWDGPSGTARLANTQEILPELEPIVLRKVKKKVNSFYATPGNYLLFHSLLPGGASSRSAGKACTAAQPAANL